jgi:hypothetical protein
MRARHRVRHGVEPGLGGLGRRRACHSAGGHLRHCAPDTAAIAPAARDSLWICGQRKGVAHISKGSATSASISWIHLEGAQAQASPGHRSAVDPPGRSFASASNCAIIARIQTAIHTRRSRHAKSRSPYLSVLKACDLHRGLDRVGVACLAAVALGNGRARDRSPRGLRRHRPNGVLTAELRRALGRREPGSAQLLSVPPDLRTLQPLAADRLSPGTALRR